MPAAAGAELLRAGPPLWALAFPAAWMSLELDDLDADRRTAERPETLGQVLGRRPDVLVAVNGPMFSYASGEPRSYGRYERALIDYRHLDRAAGIDFPGRHPGRGACVAVVDGRAVVVRGGREPAGATVALQGYPALVVDGAADQVADQGDDWRPALGVLDDGRVLIVAGRASLRGLGPAAREITGGRCTGLVYLDGGGSTAWAVRAERPGAFVWAHGLSARRVPSYVLGVPPALRRGASPGELGPAGEAAGTGGRGLAVLGGLAALALVVGAIGAALAAGD